ncbi:hypothetical protein ACYAFX_09205 [Rhodococcus aetherivorans]
MPAPHRALDELAAYVAGLSAPERDAIRRRVLGDEPPDPDAPSTFAFGTAVGDLLAALRVDVRPVAALDRMLGLRPELAQPVPGLDVPLWRALARLDDRFEVVDGWVAVPGLAEAERRTHALLAEFESPNGVVEPAAVAVVWDLPAAEFAAWLRRCGVPMFEGRALTRRSAFADHAAAVLEVIGDPLPAAELVDRMGTPAGPAAVIDAIGADERFTLSEDGRWSLSEWETDEAGAVRGRIARIVDADGGSADLDRVVDRLVERFGVSPTSARIFAGSGDFEIVDGRVRRRRRTHVSIKPPHRTRRLYRLGDVWRLRVTATRDHLRGADFPVPSAVAGSSAARRAARSPCRPGWAPRSCAGPARPPISAACDGFSRTSGWTRATRCSSSSTPAAGSTCCRCAPSPTTPNRCARRSPSSATRPRRSCRTRASRRPSPPPSAWATRPGRAGCSAPTGPGTRPR